MKIRAIGVAAVTASALASVAFAGMAHASVTPRTTPSDVLIRTTANTNLSSVGGAQRLIEKVSLPAGKWVLQATETMVNFGPSDYGRCTLFKGTTPVAAHATMVGNPTAAGAMGPAAFVGTVSETDAVVLSATTTVSVQCNHDTSNGSIPYIDADAELWAHRSSALTQLTTP